MPFANSLILAKKSTFGHNTKHEDTCPFPCHSHRFSFFFSSSMRSTINHLIQLQELVLIRDEQHSIKGPKADTKQLDEAIERMTESLDPAAKTVFKRLSNKDHIVMAPMNEPNCSVCGMKLAISQIQGVKQCKTLVACPSCARILYDPSGAKWIAERPKRSSGEVKSGIARFSAPSLMIADLDAQTPQEAIAALAGKLMENKFIDDADKLVASAMERENTLGTDVGHGLAFPHVRGIEGGGLSVAFGISRKGIRWNGVQPVHFIFFSTIPTAVSVFYLKVLAGPSESFTKETNRKAALEAKSDDALWKTLVKATRYTIK